MNLGNNSIYDQKAEFCNKYMQLYFLLLSKKQYECECTEYTLNRLEYNIILPTIKKTGRKSRCIRLCSYYNRIDFWSGSGIDPIQCEQCLGKSNRTRPVWSWAVHTISDRYLFWSGKSKCTLESKRVITRFRSKNGADPLNRSFTLGAERSKKLSDTERITFGIGAFQLVIVTGIVPDQRGQMWTEGLSDTVFGALW